MINEREIVEDNKTADKQITTKDQGGVRKTQKYGEPLQ